ncbi:hypothetical protein ACOSP7_008162 [Xanthoceras sorbifolium]
MLYLFILSSTLLSKVSLASVLDPYTISINSFGADSCTNGTLICMGSVAAGNGYLSLTPELEEGNSTLPLNMFGRVLFNQPVAAWPATITTTFTVRISKFPNTTNSGDGLAFIMAQDNSPSPPLSFGSYLGIMDGSTKGGVVRQLAVELDTYMNEFDPDANHIGIDTTSLTNPVAAVSLNSTGIDLKSGKDINVKIDYDGWTKILRVSVAYAGSTTPLVSILNQSILMSETVPSSVYVGFTASTGSAPESHKVLNWVFTSIPLPIESLDSGRRSNKKDKMRTILAIVVPGVMVLLVVASCFFPFVKRKVKKKKEKMKKKVDIESRARTAANVPKMFSYKQLQKATHNFSKENLLGKGGFGSVYKGTLSNPPTIVAVKKISATSHQGEREYFAEICTIGRLRHKNIVQLLGWCHEGEHLLLVYEYMANGSLDRFIGKGFLDWKTRYKILLGLASSLLYLHEECDNPVVHRDVKPNNVMLDSEHNAHLGDFGLARLIQNDSCATTMLAGTPGYLAPEVGFSGKSTPESDVYSFGMVVLEVVCGRRSRGILEENSLVDCVWGLYARNALLECVDKQLLAVAGDGFDEEQVKRTLIVGLACLHPDCTFRPKIRKAVQVFLNPNEPLMDLPESRPNAVYVSVSSSSSNTTTTNSSLQQPMCRCKTDVKYCIFVHTFHASTIPCNASSIETCPASLYFVPKTTKSLKETASLFSVNSNVVNRTIDGFLIGINCSCMPDHDEYTWHMDYTVQHGDTWKKVSAQFGSFVVEKPEKTLIQSQIVTLDLLCGCSESTTDIVTYKIESGDTLFTICSRFKADVNQTAKLNGLANPNRILAGHVIFIPGPGLQKLILPEDIDPIVRKKSKSRTGIVVGSTLAAFSVILVAVTLVFWRYYKRKRNRQLIVCPRRTDCVQCYLKSCPFHRKSEESMVSSFSSEKSTVFLYREVCDATSNFSMSLKIGQGSYGSVFHGKLKGTDVAIKQMKNTKSKEFLAELNILCKVRHLNLIELIGYAAGGDSLFLVYEYAQNGALSDHLHKPEMRGCKPLAWTARVQVALDAAKGLEHIHECTKPYYVHRDVKTSNILLDSNYRAKIADFGLVKLLEHSPEVAATASRIVGTFGYLAPEYVRDGCVTTKSDVYSFGVVLMELITGLPALTRDANPGNDQYSEHRSLVDHVLSVLNETENIVTELTNLLDPNLTHYHKDSILQMALLAKDCVDENWRRRPDMSNVAIRLSLMLISSQEWEKEECIYKSWHST